jgi:hypothetical protein
VKLSTSALPLLSFALAAAAAGVYFSSLGGLDGTSANAAFTHGRYFAVEGRDLRNSSQRSPISRVSKRSSELMNSKPFPVASGNWDLQNYLFNFSMFVSSCLSWQTFGLSIQWRKKTFPHQVASMIVSSPFMNGSFEILVQFASSSSHIAEFAAWFVMFG